MKNRTSVRFQLVASALILGIWALLVLAFAGQLVFTTSTPWETALRISLRDWIPWAVLAPVTAWLAWKFPLEREKLHLSIPVHVVGCMLMVLACDLIVRQLPSPFPQRPDARAEDSQEDRPRMGMRWGPGPGPGPGSAWRDGPPQEDGPPPRLQDRPRGPMHMGALVMRARFNLPIYWVIVSIVHALIYYRRSREKEMSSRELEARLTEAKLQALRMQLHPHFLFNTLNAISTLVHTNPKAADEMIGNLSELLRATLDTTEQEISLRRELEFLDRYLEIQQARFRGRLKLEKSVAENTLAALVPTLVLQPLVENAIRHGVEPQTGTGLVRISAAVNGANVLITIEDDGPGTQNKGSSGIGLANTRARLEQLYGTAGILRLLSPERGFAVQVQLPYHEHTHPHS